MRGKERGSYTLKFEETDDREDTCDWEDNTYPFRRCGKKLVGKALHIILQGGTLYLCTEHARIFAKDILGLTGVESPLESYSEA